MLLFSASARALLLLALSLAFWGLFATMARREHDQPALRWYALAQAICAGGVVLLALRGLVPSWLATTFGNAAFVAGFALNWAGARRSAGERVLAWPILAAPAAWLGASAVPGFLDDPALRIALLSEILTLTLVAIGVASRRDMQRERLRTHPDLLAIVTVTAMVQVARGSAALLLAGGPGGGVDGPVEATFGIVNSTLLGTFCVLLAALAMERKEVHARAALSAARDAALAASQEKTRFLARMSHEIRTPLNALLGFTEALMRAPGLGPLQREQVAAMVRAGDHLRGLIDEALDLARIESGALDLAPEAVPLEPCLAGTLALLRPQAEAKALALRFEPAPGLPAAVLADPRRLRQILLNLVGNAVKFTLPGGTVTLRADWADGVLRLAVADDGPGVPEALRPRLFEEFAHGTPQVEGSGLGLAISARLARAMGGGLGYAPGPAGRGSLFTARLRLPAAALPEPEPARNAVALPPLRLLVVDDVATNRAVVRALLSPGCHEMAEAASGAAALTLLREGLRPDAVLLDIHMPGEHGHDVARAIRALPGAAGRVPILALTADAMPEDEAASRAAGMDGHLTKPLDPARLQEALARVVAARREAVA